MFVLQAEKEARPDLESADLMSTEQVSDSSSEKRCAKPSAAKSAEGGPGARRQARGSATREVSSERCHGLRTVK